MSRRRRLVVVALVLAAFAAVGVRSATSPPTADVRSIREAPAYQDTSLLTKAWALPVASTYRDRLAYQRNGSTCGPTSLANALTSFGSPATEQSVLAGTGKCWTGICVMGLSLDELADVSRKATPRTVTILRDLTFEAFRGHVQRFNDPSRRYLVNFQRAQLFGVGGGHHSPIGGFLADEDLVFVLDVNAAFAPWLVSTRRLFDAIDTVDGATHKRRGLLLLE